MKRSVIYQWPFLYKLMIFFLYRNEYKKLYRKLAERIENHSSVADLCCGFGEFYSYALKKKDVDYLGVDFNPVFVAKGLENGVNIIEKDIIEFGFPKKDYYVIISSLYHFYPNPEEIIKKMLGAASKNVIIAEPVKNLLNSKSKVISRLALSLTKEGKGKNFFRFTEESLDDLIKSNFKENIGEEFYTDRDKIFILKNL